MKKLLLGALMLASILTSCSDDSDNNVGNGLVQMKQTTYDETGAIEEKFTINYQGGKPTTADSFTPNGVLTSHTIFSYEAGLLHGTMTYSSSNTLLTSTEYTYDGQGRISAIDTQEGTYHAHTGYTFNGDNTITATTNSGATRTFYLNSSGLVYKQTNGNSFYEITYSGSNPASATNSFGGTTTFTYDEQHDFALLGMQSPFGNYQPNEVLAAQYLQDANTYAATKYLIAETSPSYSTTHVYTFDEQGRPATRKDYGNGVLQSEVEYVYE